MCCATFFSVDVNVNENICSFYSHSTNVVVSIHTYKFKTNTRVDVSMCSGLCCPVSLDRKSERTTFIGNKYRFFFFFIMIIQKKSPAESFVNLKTKRYKESNSFLVKFCRETIALENRSTPNRVRIRLK